MFKFTKGDIDNYVKVKSEMKETRITLYSADIMVPSRLTPEEKKRYIEGRFDARNFETPHWKIEKKTELNECTFLSVSHRSSAYRKGKKGEKS